MIVILWVRAYRKKLLIFRESSTSLLIEGTYAGEVEEWNALIIGPQDFDLYDVDDTDLSVGETKYAGVVDDWEHVSTSIWRCCFNSVFVGVFVVWVGLGFYLYIDKGNIWLLATSPLARLGIGPLLKVIVDYYYPHVVNRKDSSNQQKK